MGRKPSYVKAVHELGRKVAVDCLVDNDSDHLVVQTCETRPAGNLGGYVLFGTEGSIRSSNDGYEVFAN